MTRYWYLFLFMVSWLGCFSQNAVDITDETDSVVFEIMGASELMDLSQEDVPEITKEDSEFIESKYEDNLLVQSGFMDYKESKYWGRYTSLRNAGWIIFGAGLGFFVGGYAMILGAWSTTGDAADCLGVAGSCMLISSPVLVLTSIPLLACAYYNRNKAKKMYLNFGTSTLSTGGHSPFKTSTPALSFSLVF